MEGEYLDIYQVAQMLSRSVGQTWRILKAAGVRPHKRLLSRRTYFLAADVKAALAEYRPKERATP